MNLQDKFWYLLIKIRDYEYHLTLKSYGEQEAIRSKGKRDIRALVAMVYISFLFISAHLVHYYVGVDKQYTHTLRTSKPLVLIVGFISVLLPVYGISEYLFKKMEATPIPDRLAEETYQEGRKLFLYSVAACPFLLFGFSIVLMRYVIRSIDFLFDIHR